MAFLAKQIMAIVTAIILMVAPELQYNAGITQDAQKFDNVILMIGDGMGINSVRSAKHFYGIDDETLNMETFPVLAWSDTDNIYDELTDSAAGGTALSCGIHTYNGSIATYLWDKYGALIQPQSLSEYAKEHGKAAGVITTDKTTGATPGSFSAHAQKRGLAQEIVRGQMYSDLDLIWGGADKFAMKDMFEKHGFTYFTTETEMNALQPGSRSYGQLDFNALKYVTGANDTPTLDEMTAKAIELLNTDEDGFFLMVEGACIDKWSHGNSLPDMAKSLMEFDRAIGVAMDFAEKDGDTLILVTADHETGGITYDPETGDYYYTTGSHTDVDVPVYVSTADAGFEDGATYINRQLSVQLAYTMGATPDAFPAIIYGYAKPFRFLEIFKNVGYYIGVAIIAIKTAK